MTAILKRMSRFLLTATLSLILAEAQPGKPAIYTTLRDTRVARPPNSRASGIAHFFDSCAHARNLTANPYHGQNTCYITSPSSFFFV